MTTYSEFIEFVINKLAEISLTGHDLFICKLEQLRDTRYEDILKDYVESSKDGVVCEEYDFICGFRLIDVSGSLGNQYLRSDAIHSCVEVLEQQFIICLQLMYIHNEIMFIKQLVDIYDYVVHRLPDILENRKERDARAVIYRACIKAYWNPHCEMGKRMAVNRYNKMLEIH